MSGDDAYRRRLGPVLHPTDLGEGARRALPYALFLAALAEGSLHLLHVADPGADGPSEDDLPDPTDEWERVRGWLDASDVGRAGGGDGASGVGVRRAVRRAADPAEAILGLRAEIGAGSICMGTRGRRGVRRWVLGSVAEEVVRAASVPVLTTGPDGGGWGPDGLRRIVVPVDLSPMMGPALAWASVLADATGAEVTAVHVVRSAAGATRAGKRQVVHDAARAAPGPDVDFRFEVLAGDPAGRVRDFAAEEDVDLLVTASHGRSGASRVALGSVAEDMIRRSPCPVLTVSGVPD